MEHRPRFYVKFTNARALQTSPGERLLEVPAVEDIMGNRDEERVMDDGSHVLGEVEVPEAPAEIPLKVTDEEDCERHGVRPYVALTDEGLIALIT